MYYIVHGRLGSYSNGSQMEVRVMAAASGDKQLASLFGRGEDIYRQMAAKVFRVNCQDVSSTQRKQAKQLSLGLLYGMGDNETAKRIGGSVQQARNLTRDFFKAFPQMNNWINQTKVG